MALAMAHCGNHQRWNTVIHTTGPATTPLLLMTPQSDRFVGWKLYLEITDNNNCIDSAVIVLEDESLISLEVNTLTSMAQ